MAPTRIAPRYPHARGLHHRLGRVLAAATAMASLTMSTGRASAQFEDSDVPAETQDYVHRQSGQWQVLALPASINPDQTIRLIGGHTQYLDLMFQASDEVTARPGPYRVELTLGLPAGVRYAHARAGWSLLGTPEVTDQPDGSQSVRIQFNMPQNRLAGKPGARVVSEWRNLVLCLDVADRLPSPTAPFTAVLIHESFEDRAQWPLEVLPLPERQEAAPQHTTIGLWDYNINRSGREAGDGIARFLAAAGVNASQNGGNHFHQPAANHGIEIGGYIHHQQFQGTPELNDRNALGKEVTGHFPSAVRINQLPEGTEIPGARQMVAVAQAQHGMVTYDFEPMGGRVGFTPEAIALFKKQLGVSDADFDAFHQQYVEHNRTLYMNADETTLALYHQWVLFHSQQSAEYIRRVNASARALWPEIRIAVTTNVGFADDDLATLGYGYNAARISPHVDVMMPQIYVGYDGAAAKLTMTYAQAWRQAMDAFGAENTQLWPLILVRYAGAYPPNSPERIRQQMIGVLAHGADGLLFYYPGNMDAPYWQTVARTVDEIARYERFYQQGKRVDERFSLREMEQSRQGIRRWPGHRVIVENPKWAFTAHEHADEILLTLFNLGGDEKINFTLDIPAGWQVKRASGAERQDAGPSQWRVAPEDIGYVILGHQ